MIAETVQLHDGKDFTRQTEKSSAMMCIKANTSFVPIESARSIDYVNGKEPDDPSGLANVSWVRSALDRTCTTCPITTEIASTVHYLDRHPSYSSRVSHF